MAMSDGAERGLYEKYEVLRDGEPVEGTFVLRPETDQAAQEAILAYADVTGNEELAGDLRLWIDHCQNAEADCSEGGGRSDGDDIDRLIREYLEDRDELQDATLHAREFAIRDFLNWIAEGGSRSLSPGTDREVCHGDE